MNVLKKYLSINHILLQYWKVIQKKLYCMGQSSTKSFMLLPTLMLLLASFGLLQSPSIETFKKLKTHLF